MLPVTLDRTCGDPLPAQLASQIRTLVLSGTLSTGDRLPSTRALAADLGVSRAVTEHAYDQLSAEGWLEARRGSGTFVTTTGATGARPQKVTARPARATPRHPGGRCLTSTPALRSSTRGWSRDGGGHGGRSRRPLPRAGTTTRVACPSSARRWRPGSGAPAASRSAPTRSS